MKLKFLKLHYLLYNYIVSEIYLACGLKSYRLPPLEPPTTKINEVNIITAPDSSPPPRQG